MEYCGKKTEIKTIKPKQCFSWIYEGEYVYLLRSLDMLSEHCLSLIRKCNMALMPLCVRVCVCVHGAQAPCLREQTGNSNEHTHTMTTTKCSKRN